MKMKYYETINKLIKEDKITFKEACEMIESVVSELLIPMVKDEVRKQLSNQNSFDETLRRIWKDDESKPWKTNIPGDPINPYPTVMYGVPNTSIQGLGTKLLDDGSKYTAAANDITCETKTNDFTKMTVNGNSIEWSKDKQVNS